MEFTPGRYRHFKGGEYEAYGVAWPGVTSVAEFSGLAQHSENAQGVCLYIALAVPEPRILVDAVIYSEPLVIYRPLYGNRRLTARPLSMWSEHVERDGYTGPRFRLVEG